MAQLQKGQSYPELGIRVDNKGITYDLKTGQSLSRSDVDALVRGTDYANLGKKRGGVSGVYDRNKKIIVPILDVAATTLSGGAIPPGVTSAAIRGADQEGHKFGSRFDVGDAAKGYASGYLANVGADAVGNGIVSGLSEGSVGAGLKAGIASLPGGSALIPGMPSTAGSIPFSDVANANVTSSGGTSISGLLNKIRPVASGLLPSGQGLGTTALEIGQGLNAADLSRRSTDAANNAVKILQQNYDAKAPLRQAGIAGMLKPVSVDTSGINAMRLGSNNPFARPIAVGG